MNAFIAFIIVCLFIGIAEGMPLTELANSIKNGLGETMGDLIMILGFGSMLGKIVADSGAAQQITNSLVRVFGIKNVQWALILSGFIIGIPLFYDVGFIILVPLVFTVAASTNLPLLYIAVPMLSALSVTHGFLPPHPGPTAITTIFEANLGKVMIYGMIIAIPCIIFAGPIYSSRLKHLKASPNKAFYNPVLIEEKDLPGMIPSILIALLPVLLIGVSALLLPFLDSGSFNHDIVEFCGEPSIAMLLSVLIALYFLGIRKGRKMKDIMLGLEESVSSVTMVILIIAGAGALKHVFVDSGVNEYVSEVLEGLPVSPLLLAWGVAAMIRICVGSATIAGLTAAGIVLPMLDNPGVNPELMVLACGAGSLVLSHVNDGGFWMFKEFFNLSVKQTLKTWTVMETIISIVGIAVILLLDLFV